MCGPIDAGAAVAFEPHRTPTGRPGIDDDTHGDGRVVGNDERLEQDDVVESNVGGAARPGGGDEQLEMTGTGKHGDAGGRAVLIDHPMVPDVDPPAHHRSIVMVDTHLSQHRVFQRTTLGQPEVGPAGRISSHPDARPDPECEGDDTERSAPPGERVEHAVGCNVGGLTVGSEHGTRRRQEYQQVRASSFEFVGEHERCTCLRFGDEPQIVGRGRGDRPVAQTAGGVNRTVESACRPLGVVERRASGPHRSGRPGRRSP